MATANAITALDAGADAVSVTVGGMGERAGNAALEQVVMAIRCSTVHRTNVDPRHCLALCERVAHAARREIPSDKPVVGKAVFSHESGVHCHGVSRDPQSFQPFDPAVLGRRKSEIVAGKHSGTSTLVHILAQAGLATSTNHIREALPMIRRAAQRRKRSLSLMEVLEILVV
jgi:homocitrate synthase NifV